MIFFTGGLP